MEKTKHDQQLCMLLAYFWGQKVTRKALNDICEGYMSQSVVLSVLNRL